MKAEYIDEGVVADVKKDVETSSAHSDKVLTKREIQGWLAYAVAAEPYSVVCISALAPIVLEALASGYGRQTHDKSLPCDTCEVKVGSLWLDTASFSLYCISVSVFLQARTRQCPATGIRP
ncbi:Autophagy protein 22 [Podila clonocystis]|nr:Autophagy protein 22 [Podila clonocystis]